MLTVEQTLSTAFCLSGSHCISLSVSCESADRLMALLQDAHCGADIENSILPNIQLADGHLRRTCQTNAIMDMWRAMENAQQIIYIINWHFNPETKNPFDEGLPNIGELLKRKSEQGMQDIASHATRASDGFGHKIVPK